MRVKTRDKLIPLTLLAAASGARATAGAAVLYPRGGAARVLGAAELVADKMPGVPDRVELGPLLARTAAGAAVGAIVAGRMGMNRGQAAVLGGLIAFASAHATFQMRRLLAERLGSRQAGIIEDALVVGTAVMGAKRLRATQRMGRLRPNYLRG